MNTIFLESILMLVVVLSTLALLMKPLGLHMFNAFEGNKTYLDFFAKPMMTIYSLIIGKKINENQTAKSYFISLMMFSLISLFVLFLILKFQSYLPLNPNHIKNMSWDQALNTAVSFVTNTNWQSYSGETGVSYFSQMAGLAVQNFLSAAVGISVAIVLLRSLKQDRSGIGNFWYDLGVSVFFILLPLSIIVSLIFVCLGIPQNIDPNTLAHTISQGEQVITQGPIASQESIKSIGTNGGGFFNANSAHPFENPNAITNFIQVISILLIPCAFTYVLGKYTNKLKLGWLIFGIMSFLFIISYSVMSVSELHLLKDSTTHFLSNFYDSNSTMSNMEGKEVRFGFIHSTIYNTASTAASDGGVNSFMDSYTPIGGMMALINMATGEIIYGGVGAGLYGMLMYVILAVFIGSLMIGRIPSFLGKRIDGKDMKLAMLSIIVPPCLVLIFTALTMVLPEYKNALTNDGAHGFTEILYAFTSASNNNGSAFSGLRSNTIYFNTTLALCMFLGRFVSIFAVIFIARNFINRKNVRINTTNDIQVTSFVFSILLLFTIVVIGALTFFPALSIGPLLDNFSY